MNIRLTSELRAELQRLADADGRKLSAYIERLLQLHVREAAGQAPEQSRRSGGAQPTQAAELAEAMNKLGKPLQEAEEATRMLVTTLRRELDTSREIEPGEPHLGAAHEGRRPKAKAPR